MLKNYNMKSLLLLLICLVSLGAFSQEENEAVEEFLPIVIEGKEAFMSTKTGEYVYRSHKETDPEALITTASGVVYTDISYHSIKKGESLYSIAKKHGQSIDELKKNNKLKSSNLDIGQKLKIVKKLLVKSSSPVISYAGEERIIAKLNPGQSPTTLNPPSNVPSISPTSKPIIAKEEKLKEDEDEGEINKFHTVKSGETLFSIAKKYKLSIQKLKDLNNLTLNNLSIGQKLKLQ